MTVSKGYSVMIACRLAVIVVASAALSPATGGAADRDDRAIADATTATLPELVEFLRLPNIVTGPADDIGRNADWLEATFRRHGLDARQLEADGTRWVFAETPAASNAKRTIIFYAHMDGQAVVAVNWTQPDPFVPVLKQTTDGGDRVPIDLKRLFGPNPDPEWRLFARSAADDKAPIPMLIAAIDALRAAGRSPEINIKIIIDPHEEGGSPSIANLIADHRDLLKADAVVMLDGPMHASNRPTIVYGNRGAGGFAITVFGARSDVHSGHYGNYAPNPVFGLSHILASMKDRGGRVRIPGFYDGVDVTAATRSRLAAVPDDASALRTRLGIAEAEGVGKNYQEAIAYPTLNVTAITAGETGSGRSIIPAFATAEFDIRPVPGTPIERQFALVRAWIQRQGYHLVERDAPTEEERARWPRLAAMHVSGGFPAVMTPRDTPLARWVRAALRAAHGQEPVDIPLMGRAVPSASLVRGLDAPVILARASTFVEFEPQTRIEGEIQQMSADYPVTELRQILSGEAPGRSHPDQITLFDSVGFAIEDFSALRYIHDKLEGTNFFQPIDMLADPDDPRDLFGMLQRAAA